MNNFNHYSYELIPNDTLLIIPALNEEEGIRRLLEKAEDLKLHTVVLDGGSTDSTREIARNAGVRVVNAPRGKGKAFRFLLRDMSDLLTDKKYLLMIDADGTYDLHEFFKLNGLKHFDMVIGERVAPDKSFSFVRLFGNKLFNSIASAIYGTRVPDLLSGYRLINLEKLRSVGIEYDGFELETELTAKFLKNAFSVGWVPVSYCSRVGSSKLSPLMDGLKILKCMIDVRLH